MHVQQLRQALAATPPPHLRAADLAQHLGSTCGGANVSQHEWGRSVERDERYVGPCTARAQAAARNRLDAWQRQVFRELEDLETMHRGVEGRGGERQRVGAGGGGTAV